MKIFISWSGEKSKEIASVFKEWIPAVIQAAKPYFSPSDIDKGARWSNEIAQELEASKFGLICLTDDNLQAPWLMFEAGALSKSMDQARVCPMLFGVEPTDLAGPLVQFQAAPFSKDEVHKVIKTINSQLGESALEPAVVDSVFTKWWPELEEKIQKILTKERKKSEKELRSDRELLEEVLKISRTLYVRDREDISRGPRIGPIRVLTELMEQQLELIKLIGNQSSELQILYSVRENGEKSLQLLLNQLPGGLQNRYISEINSALSIVDGRIKEIEDIPF